MNLKKVFKQLKMKEKYCCMIRIRILSQRILNFCFQLFPQQASFESNPIVFHFPWKEISNLIPSKDLIFKFFDILKQFLPFVKSFKNIPIQVPSYSV
jgi:hypothetical protein